MEEEVDVFFHAPPFWRPVDCNKFTIHNSQQDNDRASSTWNLDSDASHLLRTCAVSKRQPSGFPPRNLSDEMAEQGHGMSTPLRENLGGFSHI